MIKLSHAEGTVNDPTCPDGDSAPRVSVALILSGVARLQGVVAAEPPPVPLRSQGPVSEAGEDKLRLPSFAPMKPPLAGFGGATAGEQRRPA